MADKPDKTSRDARLKAALRDNLKRRKAAGRKAEAKDRPTASSQSPTSKG